MPISFGYQLSGTYTIDGTNNNGTTQMAGTAVIIENSFVTPSVTISTEVSEVCEGTEVIYFANAINGGYEPIYQWLVDGLETGENSITLAYIPENNDQISLILTSSEPCTLENPVQSNSLTAVVNALPVVSWTFFEPDTLCEAWESVQLSGGLPEGGNYSGAGVSGNIFNPTTAGPGNHQITYTYENENGCISQAYFNLFVDICEDIKIIKSYSDIYPNPTTGIITIGMNNNQEILNIEVYNSLGMTVYKKQGSFQSPVSVSLNDLPSGNYILKVVGRSKTIVKSIILN